MSRARETVAFAAHVVRLWRAGQLRFRLETFGVYYPSLPNQRSWWGANPRTLGLLIRQMFAYATWLSELDALRGGYPEGGKQLDFLLTGSDDL